MTRLLAAALALSLAAPVHAAPHGILWAAGQKPLKAKGAKTTGLQYYGGPVIEHAKVYVVLWGDKIPADTQAKLGPFYTSMLDSVYMDWLSEYHTDRTAVDGRAGTKQTIGRGTYNGSFTITPANTAKKLMDADVQKELEGQIAAGKLPKQDDNSLYMVYFPSGVSIEIEGSKSCSSFCAYHEGFKGANGSIYYGVMPTCGGFGCGGGWDGLSSTSSHEAIEAITDPFPTPGSNPAYPQAWNDSEGEEISDLCQSSSARLTAHGVTNSVSAQYRNSTHGCYNGPWTPALTAERQLALAMRGTDPKALALLDAPVCFDGR